VVHPLDQLALARYGVPTSRDRTTVTTSGLAPSGAAALRPLERAPLYEAIAERLLSYVVQSELAAGDRLPGERELARRLGVSRTTVRQAIVALQAQGVLEVRHGGGTFVRDLAPGTAALEGVRARRDRLPAVLEARRALEIPLARLAARRRTDRDLAAIADGLDRMRREVAEGAIGLDGDAAFHGAVAGAAHNPVLAGLLDALAEEVAETRAESLSQEARPPRSLADHEAIAGAIEAGDEDSAAAAMEAHLDHVADLRLFAWDPETGSRAGGGAS
jgi:GntR family transcriptional regulator, transcriptional repressor for pyruvate dehydrogenase complex